jgi:hypothetical protein
MAHRSLQTVLPAGSMRRGISASITKYSEDAHTGLLPPQLVRTRSVGPRAPRTQVTYPKSLNSDWRMTLCPFRATEMLREPSNSKNPAIGRATPLMRISEAPQRPWTSWFVSCVWFSRVMPSEAPNAPTANTHKQTPASTFTASPERHNVKATGPPTLAAKPPRAVVGPCWPICYAWASSELLAQGYRHSLTKGSVAASFFARTALPDLRRTPMMLATWRSPKAGMEESGCHVTRVQGIEFVTACAQPKTRPHGKRCSRFTAARSTKLDTRACGIT